MKHTSVALILLSAFAALSASAQDTTLFLDLVDQNVRIGDTVRVPVMFTSISDVDSIPAFRLDLIFDQPGLVTLDPARYYDTASTLCSGWETIGGVVIQPAYLRVVALADGFPPDGLPMPIPAGTSGQKLVEIIGYVPCAFEPFGDYEVGLGPAMAPQFSNTQGQSISPIAVYSSTISVQPPVRGDVDGSGDIAVVDVVKAINCAFRNDCPGCGQLLADTDCSGEIDVIDVVTLVGIAFRNNSPQPCN